MANEFIIRKGYKSLAASEVTGSLKTTGDIIGGARGYLQSLYIQDKKALDSAANFLYIDPNTSFGSGIYINNSVRIDGGLLGSYNEDLQLRTGTTTRITIANADGAVRFHNYGAGYLKTDSSGNITVDTSTVEDTLQSVTDRGASTTNAITFENTVTLDSNSADSPYLRFTDSSDIRFNLYNDGSNIFTITREGNGGADLRLHADSTNYTGSYIQVGNGNTYGESIDIKGGISLDDSLAINWSGNNILSHNGTQA